MLPKDKAFINKLAMIEKETFETFYQERRLEND